MNTTHENIRVAIRFRPLNKREKGINEIEDFKLVIPDKSSIEISKESSENHRFTFDHVFKQDITQEKLFDICVRHSVDWVAEGYNTTIFAYGPTGTGKTHSMFGGRNEDRGIIPRACELLFDLINETEDVTEATVKCSFLEIYRENLRDLLVPKKSEQRRQEKNGTLGNVRIRQNPRKGIYVQGAIEKYVYSAEDVLETIKQGAEQRSVASTALNSVSSRSHAVLTLLVTQTLSDGTVISSKLNLIDLAGSENVEKSEASGITLKEAQMINKSLSSLGNVINALTEKGREHIPYRDSRLTYLLQDSLGGNSKTILISTATPHSTVYSETLNTLKFAQRVKTIKNAPKVNRNETNATLIRQVVSLTKKLADLQSKYEDSQALVEKVEKVEEENDNRQVSLLKTRCERLERRIDQLIDLKNKDEERYEEMREVFSKQRDLAKLAAQNLYKEKISVATMKSELEQYKYLYETLKENVENPSLLQLTIQNSSIRKSSLSIDTSSMLNGIAVEVDSPV